MNERRRLIYPIKREDIPSSAVLITDSNKDTVSGNVIYFPIGTTNSSSVTFRFIYPVDEFFYITELDLYNEYNDPVIKFRSKKEYNAIMGWIAYITIRQFEYKSSLRKLPQIGCYATHSQGASEATVMLNESFTYGASGSGVLFYDYTTIFKKPTDTIYYHRIVLDKAVTCNNYDADIPIYLNNE